MGEVREVLREMSEAAMKSLAAMMPKPSEMPKVMSRGESLSAFMLTHMKASRHSSRMLTECIRPCAMSGMMSRPRWAKETVERVTMAETSTAQRKTTMPNFMRPGKAESADRKTSMQMKNSRTALARYTPQAVRKYDRLRSDECGRWIW